jgi:hypothetical protein
MDIDQKTFPKTISVIGDFRWQPKGDTLVAVLSYVLVVAGLYGSWSITD